MANHDDAERDTPAARLQVLEDLEAIRKLKARYCQLCDDDHNPEGLTELFVADGVWEATVSGRYEGAEAIRGFFTGMRESGRIRNSAHHALNPLIEVDGDRATGHWRLIMLYTANVPEPLPSFFRIIGWYREAYVRTDSGWRFESLFCQVEENGPYIVAPEDAVLA